MSTSISPAVAIALSLLSSSRSTLSFPKALQHFVSYILTIPSLATSSRLPSAALNSLLSKSSQLPFFDILTYTSENSTILDTIEEIKIAQLLANVLSLGKARFITDQHSSAKAASMHPKTANMSAKELVATMTTLTLCLGKLSSAFFATERKGKSRAMPIDVDLSDGDTVMEDSTKPFTSAVESVSFLSLDTQSTIALSQITSEPFLSSLVALSTRYSASSRPALSSFLVSLLYTWSSQRESIVNNLVYSGSIGSRNGLLREIWRGWIRSSPLAKTIAEAGNKTGSSATSGIISCFLDSKFEKDWPHFILISELYSRCLMTLGDDEFFAPPIPSGDASSLSRNALTIDEVIEFSALLRNVAFALYWQPDVLKAPSSGKANHIVGTRVTLEGLRKLVRGLLQMIHARECVKQLR